MTEAKRPAPRPIRKRAGEELKPFSSIEMKVHNLLPKIEAGNESVMELIDLLKPVIFKSDEEYEHDLWQQKHIFTLNKAIGMDGIEVTNYFQRGKKLDEGEQYYDTVVFINYISSSLFLETNAYVQNVLKAYATKEQQVLRVNQTIKREYVTFEPTPDLSPFAVEIEEEPTNEEEV